MHSEFYMVDEEDANMINECRANGGRVIAVGTTSTRTLETVTDENGIVHPGSGWTQIFIYPWDISLRLLIALLLISICLNQHC